MEEWNCRRKPISTQAVELQALPEFVVVVIPYLQPEEEQQQVEQVEEQEEGIMDERGVEETERGRGEKRVFPATEKTDLESLIDLAEAMVSLSLSLCYYKKK